MRATKIKSKRRKKEKFGKKSIGMRLDYDHHVYLMEKMTRRLKETGKRTNVSALLREMIEEDRRKNK